MQGTSRRLCSSDQMRSSDQLSACSSGGHWRYTRQARSADALHRESVFVATPDHLVGRRRGLRENAQPAERVDVVGPPTGAKGLNSAMADVKVLGRALTARRRRRADALFADLPEAHVAVERFAAGLRNMVHHFSGDSDFVRRLKRADLDYMTGDTRRTTSVPENFTSLPVEA